MPGKTIGDAKKPFDPPCSPRGEPGKMDVEMGDAGFAKLWAKINGFAKSSLIS
jgi:hypothetical protein